MLLILIWSCSKKTIELDLTDHEDQKLVIEGTISSETKIQSFNCRLSSNFDTTKSTAIENAEINVYTDEGVYHYIHNDSGYYYSETAFAGISGQSYRIEVIHQGITHDRITQMPSPIYLDSVSTKSVSLGLFNSTQQIDLTLGSEADQFIRYKIFEADTITESSDTLWNEIPIPVYWVTSVVAAPNQTIELPSTDQYFNFTTGDIFKVKVYAISNDVGEYLLEMRNYISKELPNSQFHNPPYFFSNKSYGMGYGVYLDEIVYKVD